MCQKSIPLVMSALALAHQGPVRQEMQTMLIRATERKPESPVEEIRISTQKSKRHYRHMYDLKVELRRANYPFDEIYSLQGSMYIKLKDLDKVREVLIAID